MWKNVNIEILEKRYCKDRSLVQEMMPRNPAPDIFENKWTIVGRE